MGQHLLSPRTQFCPDIGSVGCPRRLTKSAAHSPPNLGLRKAMARRPTAFRQQDVTRALRAARSAGLEVVGYEIDPATGKIIINTNSRPEATRASDLDKWLARRVSH